MLLQRSVIYSRLLQQKMNYYPNYLVIKVAKVLKKTDKSSFYQKWPLSTIFIKLD